MIFRNVIKKAKKKLHFRGKINYFYVTKYLFFFFFNRKKKQKKKKLNSVLFFLVFLLKRCLTLFSLKDSFSSFIMWFFYFFFFYYLLFKLMSIFSWIFLMSCLATSNRRLNNVNFSTSDCVFTFLWLLNWISLEIHHQIMKEYIMNPFLDRDEYFTGNLPLHILNQSLIWFDVF